MSLLAKDLPQSINCNDKMLSVKELLKSINYTFNDLYIDKFWSNIENDRWIYIDEKMLIWIGYSATNLGSSKRNYSTILNDNFSVDSDFKSLNAKDFSKCFTKHIENTEINTHNKVKHLIVSPDCFKQSLMLVRTERSKEIRKYYTELERIFKFYLMYQNKYMVCEKQLLESKLDTAQDIMRNITIDDTPLKYEEYVYILTSKRYYNINLFKIGRTINLKNRLVSYNTGNVLNSDEHFYLCSIKTANGQALEQRLHKVLSNFIYKKEWYRIDREHLLSFVQFVDQQEQALKSHVNDIIANQHVSSELDIDTFISLYDSSKSHDSTNRDDSMHDSTNPICTKPDPINSTHGPIISTPIVSDSIDVVSDLIISTSDLIDPTDPVLRYDLQFSEDDPLLIIKTTKKYKLIVKGVLYNHYLRWCKNNGERPISLTRLKTKLLQYNPTIQYTRASHNNVCIRAFKFPLDYFKSPIPHA